MSFKVAWALWIAAFLVIEAIALFRPQSGDTLSEQVWGFLGGGPARYLLIGGLLAWLVIHFLGRGRWG